MRLAIKIFFILFFSPVLSAQELNNKRALEQGLYKPAKKNSFSPLKDTGLFKKDSEYYISSLSSNIDLIFSEEFTSFLDSLSDYTRRIDAHLSQIFEVPPYFRERSVFFSSPRRQISNALASVYPLPFIQIYPSGSAEFMDRWSVFTWSQDVLTHEMTHIYQLSQNSKWDRVLWPLLGPISYRNAVLPSWILEGSAVLVESIYGSGGRLFSGLARAFVFAQIKRDFSLKRLLKPYDDPFSNLEKYLHGAYFFSYLHSQYGLKGTKKLFYESSRFLPLDYYGLNSSLKRAFTKNLQDLFEEYKSYYRGLAQKQKSSPEPALFRSKAFVPINSNQKSIYFLISDFKAPAQLIALDKKTEFTTKTEKNISIGKVFYKGGKYYTSASLRTSSASIEYSLIKENFKPVKEYNSQYVMDFYKQKAVAIDTRQSHTGNSLIIDKSFYGLVDSSALMDSKGSIYYFKQKGKHRALYKNKKALVSFQSYFSYPVEVNEKEVYFIGATKYGSSLFVYKKGQGIYRLSESDTIVSARKIKGNRFLVSEIGPSYYEYKIIETRERLEKPVLYNYSFKKENIFLNKAENKDNLFHQTNSLIKTASDSSQNKFKPYRAFNQLSLQQMAFYFAPPLSSYKFLKKFNFYQGSDFLSFFRFLDPLQFNELLISNRLSENNKFFSVSYSYQKYRPAFEFSFLYKESQLDLEKDKFLIQTFKDIGFLDTKDIFYRVGNLLKKADSLFQRMRAFSFSLSYPLYIASESKLSFKSHFLFGGKEFNKDKGWKNYIDQGSQLKYEFKRKYSQAYSYHKKRELRLMYNFLQLEEDTKSNSQFLNGSLQASLTEEFGQEYFFQLNGKMLFNLWNREPINPQIEEGTVFYCSDLKQGIQNFSKKKFYCPPFTQSLHGLYQINAELIKVLNFSYYPLKMPFSLRRLAPLAGVSFFSFQNFSKSYRSFVVPFAGLESEMSFLHEKLIVKLGLSFENRIELFQPYKNSKIQLSFWLKSDL